MDLIVKKLVWAVCLSIAALLSGCAPEGIIPPDDMVSLMASFYQADATVEMVEEDTRNMAPFDSLRIYRPLLEEKGYTDEDFRNSLDYYLHHPQTLVKICAKVSDCLGEEADMRFFEIEDEEPEMDSPEDIGEVKEGAEPRQEEPRQERKLRKKMTREELKQLEERLNH